MTKSQHIHSLANCLGIEVIFDERPPDLLIPITGWARRFEIEVQGWHSHNVAAYYAALHELGHVAYRHPHDLSRYWASALENESLAWEWAFERALVPPSRQTMRLLTTEWLASYARDYPRTGGQTFRRFAPQIGLELAT